MSEEDFDRARVERVKSTLYRHKNQVLVTGSFMLNICIAKFTIRRIVLAQYRYNVPTKLLLGLGVYTFIGPLNMVYS